jgi:hypothetical protein
MSQRRNCIGTNPPPDIFEWAEWAEESEDFDDEEPEL